MRFADFVKKHFPLEHPKVSGKLAKILGKSKKRKARTISGFTRGQEVEFTSDTVQWNPLRGAINQVFSIERGIVTRVYGETIYITNERWSRWPYQAHMNNVRAI